MCGPHQVWPLRSECCGRGVPTKVVCAECMKMCCLGGKNSVVKGLKEWSHYLTHCPCCMIIGRLFVLVLPTSPSATVCILGRPH